MSRNIVECGYDNCHKKIIKRNLKRHTISIHHKNEIKIKKMRGQEDLKIYLATQNNGKYYSSYIPTIGRYY